MAFAPQFEYILFDLGHVLIELRGMPDLRKLFPGLSDRDIHRKWLSSQALQDFETGRIEAEEFAAKAPQQLGLDFSAQDFLDLYEGWLIGAYSESVPLIKKLKYQYRVGCLSNTSRMHMDKLRSTSELLDAFDNCFLSYEVGYMKPSPEIYQCVLDRLAISPDRILFFDDGIDNVEAAQQAGMRAEHVYGIEQLTQRIDELEILTPS